MCSSVAVDVKEINAKGGNVIVGTPGRIADIMKKKTMLNFNTVEVGYLRTVVHGRAAQVLVLDEADRLLDLGFEVQLLEIIHTLPKQRRTGLFSATQTVSHNMLFMTLVTVRCARRRAMRWSKLD